MSDLNTANPDVIIKQVRIPDGYALVRIDCIQSARSDEKQGFLWVTAKEYREAQYDGVREGYKLPIYYIRQGIMVEKIGNNYIGNQSKDGGSNRAYELM